MPASYMRAHEVYIHTDTHIVVSPVICSSWVKAKVAPTVRYGETGGKTGERRNENIREGWMRRTDARKHAGGGGGACQSENAVNKIRWFLRLTGQRTENKARPHPATHW